MLSQFSTTRSVKKPAGEARSGIHGRHTHIGRVSFAHRAGGFNRSHAVPHLDRAGPTGLGPLGVSAYSAQFARNGPSVSMTDVHRSGVKTHSLQAGS